MGTDNVSHHDRDRLWDTLRDHTLIVDEARLAVDRAVDRLKIAVRRRDAIAQRLQALLEHDPAA